MTAESLLLAEWLEELCTGYYVKELDVFVSCLTLADTEFALALSRSIREKLAKQLA